MEDRRLKLDFVVVGPQKTATTWLYEVLCNSPKVAFPGYVKETFFWDRHYSDSKVNDYLSGFRSEAEATVFGEVSPTYFHCEAASERLFRHNPDLKIVILIREPVGRAYSLYLHHLRKGRYGPGFSNALDEYPEIIEASRYKIHVERWLRFFGDANTLLVLQDEIKSKPNKVIDTLVEFLDIDPISLSEETLSNRVNEASMPRFPLLAKLSTEVAGMLRKFGLYGLIDFGKRLGLKRVYSGGEQKMPAMPLELRGRLQQEFKEDVVFIESKLNENLAHWKV